MNTRLAMMVALLIGSATVAVANDKFDINIYRPAIQHSPMDAYAQSPSTQWGNGATGSVKGFSAQEKQMFERAQGAAD
jgi:hypothetical protein